MDPRRASSPGMALPEVQAPAPSGPDLGEPEGFVYHLHRSVELLEEGRSHEAQAALEAALAERPRDSEGQALLAMVYFRLGLYPRAIELYRALVAVHPEKGSLRLNLAICYLKSGQNALAEESLHALVAAEPRHVRGWAYLGLAHERLGEHEKAARAYDLGGQPRQAERVRALADGRPDPAETHRLRDAATALLEELNEERLQFRLAESKARGEATAALDSPLASAGAHEPLTAERRRAAGRGEPLAPGAEPAPTSSADRWTTREPGRHSEPPPSPPASPRSLELGGARRPSQPPRSRRDSTPPPRPRPTPKPTRYDVRGAHLGGSTNQARAGLVPLEVAAHAGPLRVRRECLFGFDGALEFAAPGSAPDGQGVWARCSPGSRLVLAAREGHLALEVHAAQGLLVHVAHLLAYHERPPAEPLTLRWQDGSSLPLLRLGPAAPTVLEVAAGLVELGLQGSRFLVRREVLVAADATLDVRAHEEGDGRGEALVQVRGHGRLFLLRA